MDQLGHADPGFTLRVYRHGMRRGTDARERLRALVGGSQWTPLPSNETPTPWSQLTTTPSRVLSSPR